MATTKTKLPIIQAATLAQDIAMRLLPYCERLEIAGSIRRGKAEIGDIELIAIPKYSEVDLFGNLSDNHELDLLDWSKFGRYVIGAHKYKQIDLPEGITLDLFIVTPPAQWGVQFMIRTGSAEFSHKMVTPRSQGGFMPSNYRVKDGAIWSHNHIIETPEEIDVFNLYGMSYIEPKARSI